jgi:hypothetical protein
LIGRVGYFAEFEPFVHSVVPVYNDPNKNPCLFSWQCGQPFEDVISTDEALHISHGCPKALVERIMFRTRFPADTQFAAFHLDDTVRTIDDTSVEITSTLTLPKDSVKLEDQVPGNDDAFLFAGKEPSWTYAYYICLTGGDNCPEWTTEAPVDNTAPTPPAYTVCSDSAEDIMAVLTNPAQSLTLDDYNWNCVEFA